MGDAGLRHAVNGFGRKRNESCLGTHVDDAPTLLALHHFSSRLAREERALQIDGKGAVKVGFEYIERQIGRSHARIVYENIKLAEVIYDRGDGFTNLPQVTHIHLHRKNLSPQRAYLRHQTAILAHIAQAHRQ